MQLSEYNPFISADVQVLYLGLDVLIHYVQYRTMYRWHYDKAQYIMILSTALQGLE